jgi:Tfp pilus assembly protein PilV
MAQSPYSKRENSRGFTVVEVVVASFILMVGIVAVAGVVGSTLGNTTRSEYMTQAATLATEKLEDLNRYPSTDGNVTVPNGISVGSLASDTTGYNDEVYFSPAEGAIIETTTGPDANGNLQYETTTYTPDGHMSAEVDSTTPPNTALSTVFKRRWLIEQDQPVAGVRRVTVLVTLQGQAAASAVTFQMSMVRP